MRTFTVLHIAGRWPQRPGVFACDDIEASAHHTEEGLIAVRIESSKHLDFWINLVLEEDPGDRSDRAPTEPRLLLAPRDDW